MKLWRYLVVVKIDDTDSLRLGGRVAGDLIADGQVEEICYKMMHCLSWVAQDAVVLTLE